MFIKLLIVFITLLQALNGKSEDDHNAANFSIDTLQISSPEEFSNFILGRLQQPDSILLTKKCYRQLREYAGALRHLQFWALKSKFFY